MLSFLPAPLKGALSALLIILNTVMCVTPLMVVSFFKLIIRISAWQKLSSRIMIVIAEFWIGVNNTIMKLTQRIDVNVQGMEGLKYEGWYLVVSNHQSWVDIPILQRLFNRKIPFLKFFLKQQLIWVPMLGMAWWALDFPFMKRYSKEFLAKHPEMKGKDLETTKHACEKFKYTPVSVMNFVEGTRFTQQKHDQQKSPYKNLLKPKAGGAAFVLSAMSGHIRTMLDVTLIYHQKQNGFWDFLCGRIKQITINVRTIPIPMDMCDGDYENDPVFREKFQNWIGTIWQDKDNLITALKK